MSLDQCWAKALEYEERAQETTDRDVREYFRRLRDAWIRTANHQEIIEGAEPAIRGLHAHEASP